MRTARIDKSLAPVAAHHLVRLGEEFDGGYVVDRRSVESADILISLGVGESWAFEADCLDIRAMPLEAYDGNVGLLRYAARLVRTLVSPLQLHTACYRASLLSRYVRFFTRDRRHHRLLVGRDIPPGEVTLASILSTHAVGTSNRTFLKIDIEGSEYHLLETLIDFAPHITGLVIEFHDVATHLPEIIDFAAKFELNVAHVHCNNFEGTDASGCPQVVEMSFTQSPPRDSDPPDLPGPLDRPNNPASEDYRIKFV